MHDGAEREHGEFVCVVFAEEKKMMRRMGEFTVKEGKKGVEQSEIMVC